jgi:hypothetical protein
MEKDSGMDGVPSNGPGVTPGQVLGALLMAVAGSLAKLDPSVSFLGILAGLAFALSWPSRKDGNGIRRAKTLGYLSIALFAVSVVSYRTMELAPLNLMAAAMGVAAGVMVFAVAIQLVVAGTTGAAQRQAVWRALLGGGTLASVAATTALLTSDGHEGLFFLAASALLGMVAYSGFSPRRA